MIKKLKKILRKNRVLDDNTYSSLLWVYEKYGILPGELLKRAVNDFIILHYPYKFSRIYMSKSNDTFDFFTITEANNKEYIGGIDILDNELLDLTVSINLPDDTNVYLYDMISKVIEYCKLEGKHVLHFYVDKDIYNIYGNKINDKYPASIISTEEPNTVNIMIII